MAKSRLYFLISIVGFSILGYLARIEHFTRPFWLDEATHALGILESKSFASLQSNISWHLQPIFDYFLRKYFWFPIFGHQEFGLRLPGFIFSLMTVISVAILAYREFLGGKKT